MEKKRTKRALPYLLLGAILTSLTLIFPQLGFLEWFTLIPLFIGAYRFCGSSKHGLWCTYWVGFLTIYVYYFFVYHWFINLYPLDFIGMDNASSLAVVLAGWLGLSLLQAIPGGLIFLVFKLLHRTNLFYRAPLLRPFVFSALWVVFEWSSTLGWTGVPWGRLCLGQSEYLPILQASSLFGSYVVSFLLLLFNGLLAYAILYHKRRAKAVLCVALALCLFISNLVLGFALIQKTDGERESVKVAAIQGNVDMHETGTVLANVMAVYGEMTREAAAEGAELIVWPETAFPYRLNNSGMMKNYVSSLAQECDVTLIVGALYEDDEERVYNAVYMVSPDGVISDTVYAKRHLVPFGEYVPMRELIMTLIPPLANLSSLNSDLSPGEGSALFESEWGKLGSLLCFDTIYEELTLESVRDGAVLMMLPSNDSWWFSDSAATYQQEAQAMLHAIENGRYLVRSGNTGISSVMDEHGKHLSMLKPMVEGIAYGEVELCTELTLYTKIGNLFVYLCIAFIIMLFPIGIVLPRKRRF